MENVMNDENSRYESNRQNTGENTGMERYIVRYRERNASKEFKTRLILLLIVAVAAISHPYLWIVVALGAFFVIPKMLKIDKEREMEVMNDIPALTIDGLLLQYKGETIDLSQMERVMLHSVSYSDRIIIYSKENGKERITIVTDEMQVKPKELLEVIRERIEQGKKYYPHPDE